MKRLLPPLLFALGTAFLLLSAIGEEPKPEPAEPKTGPVSQDELMAMQTAAKASPFLLLDVRSPREFEFGFIPGAVNVSIHDLEEKLAKGAFADKTKQPVVVYCEAGGRAKRAINLLKAKGFENVRPLKGDMGKWRDAKLRIAKPILR